MAQCLEAARNLRLCAAAELYEARIRELEAEVARLQKLNNGADGRADMFADLIDREHTKIEAAEATLRAVGELPGKWRNGRDYSAAYFADELEILLKEQNDE
jgi:hypothetical protein